MIFVFIFPGIKNDFKEAMDKVEKVLDRQSAQGSSSSSSEHNLPENDLYETQITYDDLQKMMDKADKGDPEVDVVIVSEFVKYMMTKWAKELEKREQDIKMSVMGKRETGIHAQTR